MAKYKDITGNRHGKLTVLNVLDESNQYGRWWLCRCDCGNTKKAQAYTLNRGSVTSCGCSHADNRLKSLTTHGMCNTPTWRSWRAMRDRCLRPGSSGYSHYGGRGVTIHGPWITSFEAFLEDVGERPPGTTLDRIDPDGNYEPGNVRWASSVTQGRNKRHPAGSKSPHPGVRYLESRRKWVADHSNTRIGTFDTLEEALAAKRDWLAQK